MPFRLLRGGCPYCDLCCTREIARKAVYGRDAFYPFLPSKEFGDIQADGIVNFVEAVKVETQMLASTLGKCSLSELSKEDVGALDKVVTEMFNIKYLYS